MDEASLTENRKMEHINIVLEKDTQYKEKTTFLEYVKILPNSGSIKSDEVELGMNLIGKELSSPLFVSGMTGGHSVAFGINKNIAIAAEKAGIPMGVGSQRAMVENKQLVYSYDVKKYAPNLFLIGNIGSTKLLSYNDSRIQEMVNDISADMLAIHTNPGQESVQPEGDLDFRNTKDRIVELASHLDKPVIVKEVGNGISKEVAAQLDEKVFGIDVQGAGGTTWIGVELFRNKDKSLGSFWDWGIPTALSVLEVKSSFSGSVWASGGIRTASDIVKALALGADLCGMAKPVIMAERKNGAEGAYVFLSGMINKIKEEMADMGFGSVAELRNAKVEITGTLAKLASQRKLKMDKRIGVKQV